MAKISYKPWTGLSTCPEVPDAPVGEQVAALVLLVRHILPHALLWEICQNSVAAAEGEVGPVVGDVPLAVLLEERGHVVVASVVEGPALQDLRQHDITIWRCMILETPNKIARVQGDSIGFYTEKK